MTERNQVLNSATLAGLILFVLCACGCGALHGEDKDAPPPNAPETPGLPANEKLTSAKIQAAIDELTASKDIIPDIRDKALDLYRGALSRLESARLSAEAAAQMKRIAESAPATLADIKKQLQALADDAGNAAVPQSEAEATDLQQRLTEGQALSSSLRDRMNELDETLRTSALRYAGGRKDLAEEKKKFAELDPARQIEPPPGEAEIITKARQASLQARRRASAEQVALLEQEVASLPVRRRLLSAQRELAAAQLAAAERNILAVKGRIRTQILRDAQKQLSDAERTVQELAGRHPLLIEYAKQTAEKCAQTNALAQRFEAADQGFTLVQAQVQQMADSQQITQQLLDIGGTSDEFGQLLRELRDKLPKCAQLDQQVTDAEQAIIESRLQRIRLQELRKQLNDREAAAERILREGTIKQPLQVTAEDRKTLLKLMAQRSEALTRLSETYSQYLSRQAELRDRLKELAAGVRQITILFDERLLWVPSAPPIGPDWIRQLGTGVLWLSNPDSWTRTGQTLLHALETEAVPGALLALLVAGLCVLRRRLRETLASIAEALGKPHSDGFNLTLQALLITLALALPLPVFLCYMGYLLGFDPVQAPFAMAAGHGLLNAGLLLFILLTIRTMCLPRGLFGAHFGWSDHACGNLGSNLFWLGLVLAPAAFLGTLSRGGGDEMRCGFGRLTFIVASIAFGLFVHRVLHPRRGAIAGAIPKESAAYRFRKHWFYFAASAPILLGVAAAYGYYETALQIQGRLFTSGWVIVLGMIFYGLCLRWVMVAHERLSLRRSREELEKSRIAKAAQSAAHATGEAKPKILQATEIDLTTVNDQTRTLLRVVVGTGIFIGLWLVWSKIFPALGVLDRVPLWSRVVTTEQGEHLAPVTLFGLLQALMAAILTFVAASNLPGVMEITVLQRLSLDTGTRYAITSVMRYIIVTCGLLIAFERVGVDWPRMQWIVASLGIGLGFGLQEIVANFIAGLIVLFERRIRVGDTITVKDLTGTVTRIQIRATTVVDWDNREILVPNKSFITDHVINWTLSDAVTRLVLKVGIAYGSDTVLAHRTMLEAAKANPLVMDTPAPTVFFTGFGESALNFEIRVFVRDLLTRMPLTHELHMAVEKALKEKNIEIPFPQIDVRVRQTATATKVFTAEDAEDAEDGKVGEKRGTA